MRLHDVQVDAASLLHVEIITVHRDVIVTTFNLDFSPFAATPSNSKTLRHMARRASLALVALAALISCAVPGAWARPPDEEQLDIIEMVAEAEAELEQIADELETAAGEPELELELEPELPETVDEPPAPAPPAPPTPKAADAPAVALTFAENMLAGSAARLTASVLLHPFDTMRTRAQARKRAQPTGVRFGAVDIMLKGIVPQIALAMPAGAIQFAALDYAQKLLASPELAAKVPLNKSSRDLIASALGALAASVIRVPQEVRRRRGHKALRAAARGPRWPRARPRAR
jgi:hypothetical protein